MAVPEDVRPGLEEILGRAVNVRNRAKKRLAFCSENSEDALTWTTFRRLQQRRQLRRVAEVLDCAALVDDEPSLLLWGVATDPSGEACSTALVAICDRLGEDPTSRTEPDILLSWDRLLVLIEAKHRSRNDVQPNYPHFNTYLDRPELFAVPLEEVKRRGWYELVRNWRIGSELAGRRRFVLANLAPNPTRRIAEVEFAGQLPCSDARRFATIGWDQLQ